jgi:hypothetical protein
MFLNRYGHLVRLSGLLSPRAIPDPIKAGWILPDPNGADFTQTFYEDDTFPVAWQGWPSSSIDKYLQGTNVLDLWITSYDYNQFPYTQLLACKLCDPF